jgi:CobQ-like glutamine amidotransferase family enzyme
VKADPSTVRIVAAYPDLTLPQGDEGNALILAYRARARGLAAETLTVRCGANLPAADIYVVGGLEDEDQAQLARWLDSGGVLRRSIEKGAAVLGINSGFQVLGECFPMLDGSIRDGLGLLDVRTWHSEDFIEGPVVTFPNADLGLPALSGYESHYGLTELGPEAEPLALVDVGRGNGGPGPRVDGAVSGRVYGTYLHGPVLARNPELADLLLASVLERALEPLPPSFGERSRELRIAAARGYSRRGSRSRRKVKM